MEKSGISIILCCYNSKELLAPTLKHIADQENADFFPWELILVDNASTDGTGDYAINLWESLNCTAPLKVISEINPGLINARITGLKQSAYDYAIFCDDDNWLEKSYIANAYRIISTNPRIGICGGLGEGVYATGSKPDWLSENIAAGYALGPQANIEEGPIANDRFFLYGAGMVVRKILVENVYNDFNHSNLLLSGRKGKTLAAGDDSAICFFILMTGYQLWYSSHLKFKHYLVERRLSKDYTKRMYEGFGIASAHIKMYYSYLPQANQLKKIIYSYWFTTLLLQLITLMEDLFFTKKQDKPFKVKMQIAGLKEVFRTKKEFNIKKDILNKTYRLTHINT